MPIRSKEEKSLGNNPFSPEIWMLDHWHPVFANDHPFNHQASQLHF